MKFITDNTPANTANPLAYLDISIDGQAGAGSSWHRHCRQPWRCGVAVYDDGKHACDDRFGAMHSRQHQVA